MRAEKYFHRVERTAWGEIAWHSFLLYNVAVGEYLYAFGVM
jgi:hypothetical protein